MWRDFSKVVRELWRNSSPSGGAYRPDLYYMRGPGPKWHAKYGGGYGTLVTKPAAAKADAAPLHHAAEHRA